MVHVNDVCSAIWTACTELAAGSVYNLADDAGLGEDRQHILLRLPPSVTLAHHALWNNSLPPSSLLVPTHPRLLADQGTLNSYLGSIFGIQTGFHGSIKSNLAK